MGGRPLGRLGRIGLVLLVVLGGRPLGRFGRVGMVLVALGGRPLGRLMSLLLFVVLVVVPLFVVSVDSSSSNRSGDGGFSIVVVFSSDSEGGACGIGTGGVDFGLMGVCCCGGNNIGCRGKGSRGAGSIIGGCGWAGLSNFIDKTTSSIEVIAGETNGDSWCSGGMLLNFSSFGSTGDK